MYWILTGISQNTTKAERLLKLSVSQLKSSLITFYIASTQQVGTFTISWNIGRYTIPYMLRKAFFAKFDQANKGCNKTRLV